MRSFLAAKLRSHRLTDRSALADNLVLEIVVQDDDGWFYVYLHVNNDTPGTDDKRGPTSRSRMRCSVPGV